MLIPFRPTVTCMKRWGLRASSLSAVAKADAGQKHFMQPPKPQCFIHDVVASFFYFECPGIIISLPSSSKILG
jgi:hypothetical protein